MMIEEIKTKLKQSKIEGYQLSPGSDQIPTFYSEEKKEVSLHFLYNPETCVLDVHFNFHLDEDLDCAPFMEALQHILKEDHRVAWITCEGRQVFHIHEKGEKFYNLYQTIHNYTNSKNNKWRKKYNLAQYFDITCNFNEMTFSTTPIRRRSTAYMPPDPKVNWEKAEFKTLEEWKEIFNWLEVTLRGKYNRFQKEKIRLQKQYGENGRNKKTSIVFAKQECLFHLFFYPSFTQKENSEIILVNFLGYGDSWGKSSKHPDFARELEKHIISFSMREEIEKLFPYTPFRYSRRSNEYTTDLTERFIIFGQIKKTGREILIPCHVHKNNEEAVQMKSYFGSIEKIRKEFLSDITTLQKIIRLERLMV